MTTWIQTGSDRAVDLLNPKLGDIDFRIDIPESLARLARFNGHARSGTYSVAQHSVLGADAVYRQTRRPEAALAFLLHDAKEAYAGGDLTTPFKQALAISMADFLLGPTTGREEAATTKRVMLALERIGNRFDSVIYAAAGMQWPLPHDLQAIVKEYDLRMLATERRFLLGPSPKPWAEEVEHAEPIRIRGKFTVWPWPQAADEFRQRLTELCPRLNF